MHQECTTASSGQSVSYSSSSAWKRGWSSQAALAYELARWYDDRGDPDRARQAYRRIVSEAPWAAFGAIAAETELANLSDAENPVW